MKGSRILLLALVVLAPMLLQGEASSTNSTDANDHNVRVSRISDDAYPLVAEQGFNPPAPQLPLPTKDGEVFVIDDFDNKVTETDMGFNYFMGNTGATEEPEGITTVSLSEESSGSPGGSVQIGFDFTGQPDVGPFAGYFGSLFGLTDTKVSLDESGVEPPETTPFPGYFLDLRDIYRGSLLWPETRSLEELQFDVRLLSAQPIDLKIELTEERDDPLDMEEVPRRVYARHTIDSNEWQTISLTLPNDSDLGHFTGGDIGSFSPRRVSLLSFIVERLHIGDGVENPDTGTFLVDNIRLIDTDGQYPDLHALQDEYGDLLPEYTDAFLDLVRATSFLYFLDFASTDPRTGASTDYLRGGIIQDRSTFADLMSVGGVGFQLTSYVIGAERGYISRAAAAARIHSILQVLHDHPQGDDRPEGPKPAGDIGYKGFFYHFLGIDGLRKQNFDFDETADVDESQNTVELSTIDTALAIAGVLTARQYFDGEDTIEWEIRDWADEIYARVDWNFMLEPVSNQFYLGWKPNEVRDDDRGRFGRFKIDDADRLGQYSSKPGDEGEEPATIDYYTDEGVLIALLAIASPTHPVDDSVFCSMEREREEFVKTYPGSLFTYQFGSVWLDTQALGPDFCLERPMDYFENTRRAIEATRDYACDNPNSRETLNCERWGLSATEGPFDDYFAEAAPPAAIATVGQCLGSGGPIALEAEDGTGDGTLMWRSEASGLQTVWLHAGESHSLSFDLEGTALYEVDVRYSNDNFGPLETVEVSLDGTSLGQFEAQDTGDFGLGWNVFEWSGPIGSQIVAPGSHDVTVSVMGGDGYGVEIDLVSLEPIPVERLLEVGTVTVYGVASSIVHEPDWAIEALWEAQSQGLLHPRFGSGDAFNLDIADAVVPGCVHPDESRILRADGTWKHFTGLAIDHGPMLILVDNYLADQFSPKFFMSYPRIAEVLPTLFPTLDSDGDAFYDGVELYLDTDPLDACPDDLSDDAWPPDIDMNTVVDIFDALTFLDAFPSAEGSPNYSERLDMKSSDGVIDIFDALTFLEYFPSACTNP